ncbi:MAG: hypothetical protein SGPRY_004647 [Prymnesium sp.]
MPSPLAVRRVLRGSAMHSDAQLPHSHHPHRFQTHPQVHAPPKALCSTDTPRPLLWNIIPTRDDFESLISSMEPTRQEVNAVCQRFRSLGERRTLHVSATYFKRETNEPLAEAWTAWRSNSIRAECYELPGTRLRSHTSSSFKLPQRPECTPLTRSHEQFTQRSQETAVSLETIVSLELRDRIRIRDAWVKWRIARADALREGFQCRLRAWSQQWVSTSHHSQHIDDMERSLIY